MMNSLLNCVLFPKTFCDSAVASTKAVKESSIRTIPDTARAVWLPDSMATATSAMRKARTSLAPSPTIATKCLRSFSAVMMRPF